MIASLRVPSLIRENSSGGDFGTSSSDSVGREGKGREDAGSARVGSGSGGIGGTSANEVTSGVWMDRHSFGTYDLESNMGSSNGAGMQGERGGRVEEERSLTK